MVLSSKHKMLIPYFCVVWRILFKVFRKYLPPLDGEWHRSWLMYQMLPTSSTCHWYAFPAGERRSCPSPLKQALSLNAKLGIQALTIEHDIPEIRGEQSRNENCRSWDKKAHLLFFGGGGLLSSFKSPSKKFFFRENQLPSDTPKMPWISGIIYDCLWPLTIFFQKKVLPSERTNKKMPRVYLGLSLTLDRCPLKKRPKIKPGLEAALRGEAL